MLSKKTAGKCWRFCLKKLYFTSDLDDLDFEGSGLQGFEGIYSRKVCVCSCFLPGTQHQYSGQIGFASKKPAKGWEFPRKSRGRHFPTCRKNIQALGIMIGKFAWNIRFRKRINPSRGVFRLSCLQTISSQMFTSLIVPAEVDNGEFPIFLEAELHLPDFQQTEKKQNPLP